MNRKPDWPVLIDEFEASDFTQTVFCRRKNISIATFRFWLYKVRKERKNNLFSSVSIVESQKPECVELHFPDGRFLRFQAGVSAEYVSTFLSLEK